MPDSNKERALGEMARALVRQNHRMWWAFLALLAAVLVVAILELQGIAATNRNRDFGAGNRVVICRLVDPAFTTRECAAVKP